MNSSVAYLKYVSLGPQPDPEKHVLVSYRACRSSHTRLEGLAFLGAVAAESSTGTWVDVLTANQSSANASGSVYAYDEINHIAHISYPIDLFEPGNVSQLLTVIAGNAFGLADLNTLKLLDFSIPSQLARAFPGPAIGADGIMSLLGHKKPTPIIGAIMKPKCGLTAEEHARNSFEVWKGMKDSGGAHGVDMVKDDEALTHQVNLKSDFYTRVRLTLESQKRAEDITGVKKIYVPNITHSHMSESLRRAEYVKKLGGDAAMIDYVIGGCTLLHSVRLENFGLILHGHRTLFAALARSETFGVNYIVWAKLFRIIGGDQVHIGTPGVGVMSANKASVLAVSQAMLTNTSVGGGLGNLKQSFEGIKPVMPICGAGLDPTTTEMIAQTLGNQVIVFAGGGVMGHPDGPAAGAASLRESLEAYTQGVSLVDWSSLRVKPYLDHALEFYGQFDKQSPNDKAREHM